jgi:hypothetical protein
MGSFRACQGVRERPRGVALGRHECLRHRGDVATSVDAAVCPSPASHASKICRCSACFCAANDVGALVALGVVEQHRQRPSEAVACIGAEAVVERLWTWSHSAPVGSAAIASSSSPSRASSSVRNVGTVRRSAIACPTTRIACNSSRCGIEGGLT